MKKLFLITFLFSMNFQIIAADRATQTVSAEGFGVNEDEAVACADAHWGAEVMLEGECFHLAGTGAFAISDIVHGPCTCTFEYESYTCENLSTATCHY
jgi:hypothetical protein